MQKKNNPADSQSKEGQKVNGRHSLNGKCSSSVLKTAPALKCGLPPGHGRIQNHHSFCKTSEEKPTVVVKNSAFITAQMSNWNSDSCFCTIAWLLMEAMLHCCVCNCGGNGNKLHHQEQHKKTWIFGF